MRACANDSGSSPDECTRSAANSVSEPTRRKRSNGRTEREQRADPTRLASDLLLCFHSRAIGGDPSKLGLEAHHDKAATRTADVKAEYEATDGGDGSQSQYAAAQATRRHADSASMNASPASASPSLRCAAFEELPTVCSMLSYMYQEGSHLAVISDARLFDKAEKVC